MGSICTGPRRGRVALPAPSTTIFRFARRARCGARHVSPAPDTAATQLDYRLLCADANAYGISPGPTFKPDEPYYSQVRFIGPPVVIDRGTAGIDAALVGLAADGILVAFRGTRPPEQLNLAVILDWLQDFACKPVDQENESIYSWNVQSWRSVLIIHCNRRYPAVSRKWNFEK